MKKREIKQLIKMKNMTKAAALITAAAVFATSVGAYDIKAEEQQELEEQKNEAEEDLLTKVLDQAAGSVSRSDVERGKEETVYVISDANGAAQSTIVSDWLKNPEGSKTLEDASDLKNIENVKGDETFTQNGDKLTWNADGSDIYYQGTATKETPVKVNVSYYLNDKKVSPEEIAGKSGQVKIRFDYENKEKQIVAVNGKDEEVYVPFAVVTGLVLPVDNFTNISVSNGKVMSEGNNNIVVGLAFPGLKESLNIKSNEVDIPEYVEVTANAEDFEIDMTLSVAMSDILSTVNVSDEIDFSEISDKVDALTDATDQLSNGGSELAKGTKDLKKGTKQLADGANTLNSNMSSLTNGAGQLSKGINEYTAGVGELAKGIDSVKDGTAKLNKSVPVLKQGVSDLKSGSAAAKAGADQLVAGYEGPTGALAGAAAVKQGADAISAGIASAGGSLSALAGMGTTLQGQIDTYTAQLGGLQAQLAGESNPAVREAIQENIGKCEGAIAALTSVKSQLPTDLSGFTALATGASQLSAGAGALQTGMTQLYNGTKTLDTGLATLDAGLGTLNSSAQTLGDGVNKLDQGATKLKQGAAKLTGNSATLVNGGSSLAGGAAQVANAVGQIAEGANKLDSGAGKLSDGANKLSEGIVQFNDEGISKITDALDSDATQVVDKLKAVMDAGKQYQSFTGMPEGMEGTVKFIIKTDAVKAK